MTLIGIAIVGACLGVISASARVPKVKWAPTISALILAVAAVVLLLSWGQASLLEGLMLPLGAVLADALYAGALWMRLNLEPVVSYWGWVTRSFTHSGYLRRLFATQQADVSVAVPQ